MHFRSEIDGLRAIAVLPVILFHAGFRMFSGGFVGVDVFFVISGYLITSILMSDIEAGRFSLLRFYERRARRILPALFVVLLTCLPLAWAWMLPTQLEDFAASLTTTATFLSNFYFLSQVDYFRPEAELQPLLHTWSLAVEEQYYLLFPPCLAFAWRFGGHVAFRMILLVSLFSLVVAEWGWRDDAGRNFFFTLSRLWEIGAGSMVAFAVHRTGPRQSEASAVAGLAAILAACLFYDASTPFPSLYTVLPVGGTALILLYGTTGTLTARLLSHPLLVGIGLISYSAYLWHQPLFAFARLRLAQEPDWPVMLGLSAMSLGLAMLSWRFVEQPFRNGSRPCLPKRNRLFAASLAGLAGFAALGIGGYAIQGAPGRLPILIQDIMRYAQDYNPYIDRCQFSHATPLPQHPVAACSDFLTEGRADVVFIGDSHSGAISAAAQALLQEASISSYAVAYSGCIGLPGFYLVNFPVAHDCDGYNRGMLDFARAVGARTLVITSRFALYDAGTAFDNGEGGIERNAPIAADVIAARGTAFAAQTHAPLRRLMVTREVTAALDRLAQEFGIVLVYPIPEIGWNVPNRLAHCLWLNGGVEDCEITVSYAHHLERSAPMRTALDAAAPHIHRVDPAALLCDPRPGGRCAATRDGLPLYLDDDHLAHSTGAALIAPAIRDAVRQSLRRN